MKIESKGYFSRPNHLTHPQYRPDIDGLRAIAVLSVVGFHAFPDFATGGFIGVDIFFVISGYLISIIIFNSLERSAFSYKEFYGRRIRRIFPSLLIVLTACLLAGWFFLLPDEYKQLGKHVAGGAGFISNYLLWQESGYFDNASGTKPLLHLWSLGIEEQFYIIWPLLLWATWKKHVSFLVITIAITIVSLTFSGIIYRNDAAADFYSLQTRFWELLAGSTLAYFTVHQHKSFPKFKTWLKKWSSKLNCIFTCKSYGVTLKNIQSTTGLLILSVGFFVITNKHSYPGFWALLPVLGTLFIVDAGKHAWLNRTLLSNRILVWFGLISYPLYLWHWPLLSFARISEGDTPSPTIRLSAIGVSILLAWLTYKIVEHPLRYGIYGRIKITGLASLMILVGILGYTVYHLDGITARDKQFAKIIPRIGDFAKFKNVDLIKYDGRIFRATKSPSKETIFFLGDSNAEQYFPRIAYLNTLKPNQAKKAIFGTGGGCSPIPKVSADNHPHCAGLTEQSLQFVRSHKDITTVVIAAFWPNSFSNPTFPSYFDDNGNKLPIKVGNRGYEKALASLKLLIQELKAANSHPRVILVLNTPFGKKLNPKFLVSRSLERFPHFLEPRTGGVTINELLSTYQYGTIKKDLLKVARATGIYVIDPMKYLCSPTYCPAVDKKGYPIYANMGHLNSTYASHHVSYLDGVMLKSSAP